MKERAPLQLKYGLISVDDHVQEPPDLWTSRLSKRFGDRVPHLEWANGTERWVVDGQVLLRGQVARAGAFMPDRNTEPKRWNEVPTATYVPAERLKVMDAAGVDYSVLFPSVAGMAGEGFGRLPDAELELACVQAYNDWLVDEWAAASERFVPQCIVPLWPAESAVAEIRRSVARGHRGVVFPAFPMALRDLPYLGEAAWDPVWNVCQELQVPLCLHAGSVPELEWAPRKDLAPELAAALEAVDRPVTGMYVGPLWFFSRVILRHANLQVIFSESALGWGACQLEWMTHQAAHDHLEREQWVDPEGVTHAGYELTVYEMFHRQCYFNGWYDEVAPYTDYLGAGHILWSTNLPQATSTYPRTQESIQRSFKGVVSEERDRILWKNAARLYKL